MVSKPYGGKLVNRALTGKEKERIVEDVKEMPRIEMDRRSALDAEKIAIGAFSPLEGFMGQEDYEEVLYKERLTIGLPWTIPIVLAPSGKDNLKTIGSLNEGDEVALFYSGESIAILQIDEKFEYDKKEMAEQVYGTLDLNHPGVREIYSMGETILAGKIDLIQRIDSLMDKYELTPLETRQMFEERGWGSIAAYQTRNPPHMAHEYLQRCALEIVDGILIHPIIGELKEDDFPPEAIIEAYDFLVNNYYPKNRVVLATLSISMRYAGPKAAIFLAIVRKNYGCTHFIVGRDIAGIGNYYDPYGAHKIFKNLDLGIEPILFRESFYCKLCGRMATDKTCGHFIEDHVKISMTEIRRMISKGLEPPIEIMRPEISKILMKYGPRIMKINKE
ncbi:MAG: sulfate adenylyltransferase [Nitrososphaerales archaeon]